MPPPSEAPFLARELSQRAIYAESGKRAVITIGRRAEPASKTVQRALMQTRPFNMRRKSLPVGRPYSSARAFLISLQIQPG